MVAEIGTDVEVADWEQSSSQLLCLSNSSNGAFAELVLGELVDIFPGTGCSAAVVFASEGLAFCAEATALEPVPLDAFTALALFFCVFPATGVGTDPFCPEGFGALGFLAVRVVSIATPSRI